jgi:NADPH:quinone reductase-like Zn-dependent oxidoreductase
VRAIVHHDYGSPDVLKCEELAKPVAGDDEVLIRVRATSVNPLDSHFMRGAPYMLRIMTGLRRPEAPRVGIDFAGQVEAIGRNVTQFQPGDDVFGARRGAFAEYVAAKETDVALKPANLTFEQAAAIPTAALTALQALRDKGRIQPGQNVLINGAAGGVGTFAVQIAKSFGAHVTGVCSTRNVELVRSIGADQVIDYSHEDFTKGGQRYDLIVDCMANHSLSACRRVLSSQGTYIMVGGTGGRWMGPLAQGLKAILLSRFVKQRLVMFFTSSNKADLIALKELAEGERVTPVIDRTYVLNEVAQAVRYLEEGHARGKVVIAL